MTVVDELAYVRVDTRGRFRLDDWIGAMHGASIWKATDQLLDRQVTIHALPGPVPASLIGAVNTAARVADPRHAKIFDADYHAEIPYIVSEWAPGDYLEDRLRAGPVSPARAAAIIADAADALAVAHDAGRPHLCLGPRSLRWGKWGVKITGLGIDADLSGASGDDASAADTQALGRLLYAMLTGCWPGDEAAALPPAPRRRGRLMAPRQAQAGIPSSISAIALQALQVGPGQSAWWPASPAGLAAALRETGARGEIGVHGGTGTESATDTLHATGPSLAA